MVLKKVLSQSLIFLLVFVYSVIATAQSFIHPGLLHSKEDLARMKKAVADKEEPIYSGYQLFIQNPASQYTYKMQGPLAMVGRNPTVGQTAYDNDANAAHQNAIMWFITGDKRYANKAIEIVNAWSSTLKSITGKDAVLMAGLGPFKMVNAAEILRYTNSGWKEKEIQQTEKHFKEIIYPVLKDFAPFANGNWDAAAVKTVMAIAVFCNHRPMFEKALRYYTNGHGNGSLLHYVINEEGQIQESGRDQAHTQLGIGMLAECCAIAWNQGLNLYAYAHNRLLKGFEYVAKFNLGNDDVPFTEWLDRTGKYHHTKISQQERGNLRAVYEQVYNHYHNQMGLATPYIQQAAEKLRPEGPGKPGADHPGYGTLYFTRPKEYTQISSPAAPVAIIAVASKTEISLNWIESVGATAYTIKRAIKSSEPYTTIAKNVRQSNYVDKLVKAGAIYYYTVTAINEKGQSANSYETAIAAGLPHPWKQKDIGITQEGLTLFDGKKFTIESAGKNLDSSNDELHFTYQPLTGNGEIIARFIPQPSSQFSQMGLMIRSGLSGDAPFASLVIYPVQTGQIELPDWHAKLIVRFTAGEKIDTSAISFSLSELAVTWGRLTRHVWLRLQRNENNFTGSISYDGKIWKPVFAIVLPFNKNLFAGLSVSSGMSNSTTVFFDKVSIRRSK